MLFYQPPYAVFCGKIMRRPGLLRPCRLKNGAIITSDYRKFFALCLQA